MRNLQSRSFVRKQRLKRWAGIAGSVIIVSFFIYLVSWFARAGFMTISSIAVFGADDEVTQAIHDTAAAQLEGNYLGVFPRKNSFLYPKSAIIAAVEASFPRVLNVSIDRDGWQGLRVAVNEKVPAAIVCLTLPNFDNNTLVTSSDDPCYLADTSGYLFEKSPGFSGHPYNLYYAPDAAGSSTDGVGSYATSTSEFTDLQSFYDAAEHAGIAVDGLLLKDAGEYELYASSTTFYFNDAAGLPKERDNLIAFWDHSVAQARSERTTSTFDYIDLRYGSNVFYKTIK
jgi:hypothetical protein